MSVRVGLRSCGYICRWSSDKDDSVIYLLALILFHIICCYRSEYLGWIELVDDWMTEAMPIDMYLVFHVSCIVYCDRCTGLSTRCTLLLCCIVYRVIGPGFDATPSFSMSFTITCCLNWVTNVSMCVCVHVGVCACDQDSRYKVAHCSPDSSTSSRTNSKAIYEICRNHNVLILEDDPYYYLQFGERVPRFVV